MTALSGSDSPVLQGWLCDPCRRVGSRPWEGPTLGLNALFGCPEGPNFQTGSPMFSFCTSHPPPVVIGAGPQAPFLTHPCL